MIFTLADARTFLSGKIKGGSCDTDVIDDRVNEATMMLLNDVDPALTQRRMRIYLTNNSVPLPREVEKINHYSIDCLPGVPHSIHYEFLPGGPGTLCDCCNPTCVVGLADMGGHFPTFYDIPIGTTKKVAFFSTEADDAGQTILVRGRTTYKNEVLTNGTPGESVTINRWKDGTEGTIDGAIVINQSTNEFAEIGSIVKPVTKGYVSMYTLEDDWTMYFLGKYHPDDLTPNFRRYKILNHDFTNGNCLVAQVKLAYVPAKYASDPLLIQNLQALKMQIMSLDMIDREDFSLATAYRNAAIELLRQQSKNHSQQNNEFSVEDEFGPGSVVAVT